jgi:hypothetical protein
MAYILLIGSNKIKVVFLSKDQILVFEKHFGILTSSYKLCFGCKVVEHEKLRPQLRWFRVFNSNRTQDITIFILKNINDFSFSKYLDEHLYFWSAIFTSCTINKCESSFEGPRSLLLRPIYLKVK